MQEIRDTVSKYSPSNVYNVEESGLSYRMGPSYIQYIYIYIYLLAEENRAETRGTSMQKHKTVSQSFCASKPIDQISTLQNTVYWKIKISSCIEGSKIRVPEIPIFFTVQWLDG